MWFPGNSNAFFCWGYNGLMFLVNIVLHFEEHFLVRVGRCIFEDLMWSTVRQRAVLDLILISKIIQRADSCENRDQTHAFSDLPFEQSRLCRNKNFLCTKTFARGTCFQPGYREKGCQVGCVCCSDHHRSKHPRAKDNSGWKASRSHVAPLKYAFRQFWLSSLTQLNRWYSRPFVSFSLWHGHKNSRVWWLAHQWPLSRLVSFSKWRFRWYVILEDQTFLICFYLRSSYLLHPDPECVPQAVHKTVVVTVLCKCIIQSVGSLNVPPTVPKRAEKTERQKTSFEGKSFQHPQRHLRVVPTKIWAYLQKDVITLTAK